MKNNKPKFKVIAPPPPKIQGEHPIKPLPKDLNAPPEVINIIKEEVQKFKDNKATNPDGTLSNIFLIPYSYKTQDGVKVSMPQVYNIKFKGRNDTDNNLYKGRFITGKIIFPNNYPEYPPQVVLDKKKDGSPLQMVNVYADGSVCHHTIDPLTYNYPKYSLPYILREIENLLYTPNSNDPANHLLGKYYDEYQDAYLQFQRDQAEFLPLAEE